MADKKLYAEIDSLIRIFCATIHRYELERVSERANDRKANEEVLTKVNINKLGPMLTNLFLYRFVQHKNLPST